MGQRRSLVDPVPRSRVPVGSRGTTVAIQHPVGVLPWPRTQGETQLPPRHGVDGPGCPAYLDIPVDHLVPRQPPVQAVARREVQADVVPAGLEESTMGASSCSWRCHLWQRVYQCCPHPRGGGFPHLWGVVQQELAAELHHVTFQCKRRCDVWSWWKKTGVSWGMVEETPVATSSPADIPCIPPRRTCAEERLDLGLLQSLAEDGHGAEVTLQGRRATPLRVLAAGCCGGHHPLRGGLSGGPSMGAQGGGDRLGTAERGVWGEDQLRPMGCQRVAGGSGGGGGGGPVARGADAAGGEGLEGRRNRA